MRYWYTSEISEGEDIVWEEKNVLVVSCVTIGRIHRILSNAVKMALFMGENRASILRKRHRLWRGSDTSFLYMLPSACLSFTHICSRFLRTPSRYLSVHCIGRRGHFSQDPCHLFNVFWQAEMVVRERGRECNLEKARENRASGRRVLLFNIRTSNEYWY